MLKKANPSLSPAIMNAQMDAQQPQQSINKEDIFKNLFSDQAYQSFVGKYPYLNSYIQNFKIISSDSESGSAVGSFFIQIPGVEEAKTLMVPVILKGNVIQPIMFIYDKQMDLFIPLDEQWVEEILKRVQINEGEIATPDMRQININNNITGMSQLPYGRGINGLIHKLGEYKNKASNDVNTLNFISDLKKEGKEKVLEWVKGNEKLANHLFNTFSPGSIKQAFLVEKSIEKKAEEIENKESVVIVNQHTPLDAIKKDFGKDSIVMDDIATRGYHVKDTRKTKNKLVVYADHIHTLENPSKSGAYNLYLSTGKVAPALILQDPILLDCMAGLPTDTSKAYGERYKTYHVIAKNKVLVLFPNGDYALGKNDNIMASPTLAESIEGSPVYKHLYSDTTSAIPLNKPFIFIKKTGNGYITTGPIVVNTKVDEGDAIRCTVESTGTSIIYSSKYTGNNVYVTNSGTVFVPNTFKVFPLKKEVSNSSIIGSMKTVMTLTNFRLLEKGGKPITIVKDDKSNYGIETDRPVIKYAAIKKIAEKYDVNAKEVEAVLDTMDKVGHKVMSVFVMPKQGTEKIAQGQPMMMDPSMMMQPQQMPMQPMMNPQMQMQQPMMNPQMQMQQPMMDPQMQQQQMQMQQPMQQPMMAPPMDPSMMMQQGATMAQQMEDPELFDTSSLVSLSYISDLETLFPKYLPNLIKSMDGLARIIINFWINGEKLKEDIGTTEYSNLEAKLKTLYSNLADLLLTLNRKIDIFKHK